MINKAPLVINKAPLVINKAPPTTDECLSRWMSQDPKTLMLEEGRSVCRSVANSWHLIEDPAMVQGFCSANAGGVTWRLDYAWADRPDPIVIAP